MAQKWVPQMKELLALVDITEALATEISTVHSVWPIPPALHCAPGNSRSRNGLKVKDELSHTEVLRLMITIKWLRALHNGSGVLLTWTDESMAK